ncbi:hypothetical protein FGG08_003801, partial [Glutinoglossum americanum]
RPHPPEARLVPRDVARVVRARDGVAARAERALGRAGVGLRAPGGSAPAEPGGGRALEGGGGVVGFAGGKLFGGRGGRGAARGRAGGLGEPGSLVGRPGGSVLLVPVASHGVAVGGARGGRPWVAAEVGPAPV